MTPVDFDHAVEGYRRRTRAAGVYFREMYALTYNIKRGEKTEYLSPEEVLRLPGEKKKRKPRQNKEMVGSYTIEQLQEAARKASQKPTPTPDSWPEQ